jgi:hypothetical protein
LYRAARVIPFIRYEKGGLFSICCYQPIPKIIIGIGWLKTINTNKCPVWPIFKVLLVSTSLERSTPLSLVQIQKNIIWNCYETYIFFKFRIHSNIYIRHSQEYSYNITRIQSSHYNIEKFNSQIVYSQQYSQHRLKIQYSQHRSSIFTLFPSISIEITVQIPNLS